MRASFARIAEATETVARALGLDDDAEAAVALAICIVVGPSATRLAGLTHAESCLAHLLAAAAGRTIDHGTATDVTSPRSAATPVLVTRVAHLRRKRPDIGACVRTVWGVGYRWDGPPLADLEARYMEAAG